MFNIPGEFVKSFNAQLQNRKGLTKLYYTNQDSVFAVDQDWNVEYFCGPKYPKDTIRFWIENSDIPHVEGEFTFTWVEGIGYTGGHVSQAGFQTWDPKPDDKSLSISTTHSGRCTGYYPGRYYIRLK